MGNQFTRRELLRVGTLGGGLTLSGYLRLCATETQSEKCSKRSAIFIFLEGGPSHQDMFDFLCCLAVVIFNCPDKGGDFHKIGSRSDNGNNFHFAVALHGMVQNSG